MYCFAVKKGMTASRGKAVNKLCYNILAGSCVIKKDACTQNIPIYLLFIAKEHPLA